jgi:hypothetical protein
MEIALLETLVYLNNKDYAKMRRCSKALRYHMDIVLRNSLTWKKKMELRCGRTLSIRNVDWSEVYSISNPPARLIRMFPLLDQPELLHIAIECGVEPSHGKNRALKLAAEHGYEHLVQLLLSCPSVDPTAAQGYPLMIAIRNSHVGVIRLLLEGERGLVQPVAFNCLITAIIKGDVGIAQMLMSCPRFVSNLKTGYHNICYYEGCLEGFEGMLSIVSSNETLKSHFHYSFFVEGALHLGFVGKICSIRKMFPDVDDTHFYTECVVACSKRGLLDLAESFLANYPCNIPRCLGSLCYYNHYDVAVKYLPLDFTISYEDSCEIIRLVSDPEFMRTLIADERFSPVATMDQYSGHHNTEVAKILIRASKVIGRKTIERTILFGNAGVLELVIDSQKIDKSVDMHSLFALAVTKDNYDASRLILSRYLNDVSCLRNASSLCYTHGWNQSLRCILEDCRMDTTIEGYDDMCHVAGIPTLSIFRDRNIFSHVLIHLNPRVHGVLRCVSRSVQWSLQALDNRDLWKKKVELRSGRTLSNANIDWKEVYCICNPPEKLLLSSLKIGKPEYVKVALELGANPAVKKNRAIKLSSIYGWDEVTALLLSDPRVDADFHVPSDPVLYTLQCGNYKLITDIGKCFNTHRYFTIACKRKDADCVRWILEKHLRFTSISLDSVLSALNYWPEVVGILDASGVEFWRLIYTHIIRQLGRNSVNVLREFLKCSISTYLEEENDIYVGLSSKAAMLLIDARIRHSEAMEICISKGWTSHVKRILSFGFPAHTVLPMAVVHAKGDIVKLLLQNLTTIPEDTFDTRSRRVMEALIDDGRTYVTCHLGDYEDHVLDKIIGYPKFVVRDNLGHCVSTTNIKVLIKLLEHSHVSPSGAKSMIPFCKSHTMGLVVRHLLILYSQYESRDEFFLKHRDRIDMCKSLWG